MGCLDGCDDYQLRQQIGQYLAHDDAQGGGADALRCGDIFASANLLRTQVSNQVVTSYVNLHTASARVRTANVLLSSAQQSEDVARGRYKAGVGTILDLLTAQSALSSARAQQAQARWTWATALAQLAHDVGVLGVHGEAPIPLTHDSTTGPK